MKRCVRCAYRYADVGWTCPVCNFTPSSVDGFPALAPTLAEGGAAFPPEVFAELAAREAESFWFRARNRLIVWALRRRFPEMHRYLEIGCGTGFVLAGVAQAYPEAVLTGSEVFSVGLPYAASRVPQAELLQMDARGIPYEDEFDVIGAFDVLEHIEEDEAVLAEMWRALRPGGGVVLTAPQHPWLWSRQDEYACHVRRYRVSELKEKVQRAGFEIELETSFVSLLLPAMLASRVFRGPARFRNDPSAELDLPKPLNAAFVGVMALEHLIITAGLRFPVGGSCLLVGRKKEQDL